MQAGRPRVAVVSLTLSVAGATVHEPPPYSPGSRLHHAEEGDVMKLFVRSAIGITAALWLSSLLILPDSPSAQPQQLHLNPVIAKLVDGHTVYGLNTGDLSLAYAREVARAPVDFVYADLEHNPLDFPALHVFLMGMQDKAAVLRKGNLQPNVALFARFPPEADQSQWVVKQALDIGLHGVIFNGVDTPDQALFAVRTMRYPQMRDSKYHEPNGIRGAAPGNATWIWGLTGDEYERHADIWPLNPDGDLLATMMIESVEGLENVDTIASVPGVGALFPGAGNDLAHSLGVRQNSPELEAAFQQILAACKAHKIACAITANTANDIVKRVKEGWRIIRSTVPAIVAGRAQLGEQQR
jgi:4-hydroxy-2-oxoheptanedioate aldolase